MRKIGQMAAIAVAVMSPAIAHAQRNWQPSQSSATRNGTVYSPNQRVVMINGRQCVQQIQRDGRPATTCDNSNQSRVWNNTGLPVSQRQRDIDRDREIMRQREIARERETAVTREREMNRVRDIQRERELQTRQVEQAREIQRQREIARVRQVQAERERDRWVQARQNNDWHDNGRRHDDHDNGRHHDDHGHNNWRGHH